MLTAFDSVVIVGYLAAVVAFGLWAGGRQRSVEDYFRGGRTLPWWAVCLSIVATETSTLTVIGVPAVAYGGSLTFLQLALGYVIGRAVVASVLLPRYADGHLETAYAFLGERFGDGLRGLASVTFLITRLLADGVRLFATAIPIRVLLLAANIDVSYSVIIGCIATATAVYTLVGGIKAVVWMDVVQMGVYVGGAVLALVLLAPALTEGGLAMAREAGKLAVIGDSGGSLSAMMTSPYAPLVAVVGGALFSMASHGTDQLIMQRVLACGSLAEMRKAMIGSGFAVTFQFALFLAVGVGLWAFYGGASPEALALTRGDEVFPLFILEEMPSGLRGLLIAGIVAAAMSTLSSSLNALAGSTLMDLLERTAGWRPSPDAALRWSRGLTLVWAGVFVLFAVQFQDTDNPVVELGLGIAGFTYGGLLGAFVLGLAVPRAREADAAAGFVVGVVTMVTVIFGVWWQASTGDWVVRWRPEAAVQAAQDLRAVAWPLYPLIGSLVTVMVGGIVSLRHGSE